VLQPIQHLRSAIASLFQSATDTVARTNDLGPRVRLGPESAARPDRSHHLVRQAADFSSNLDLNLNIQDVATRLRNGRIDESMPAPALAFAMAISRAAGDVERARQFGSELEHRSYDPAWHGVAEEFFSLLTSRTPVPYRPATAPDAAIIDERLPDSARIALISDWGSGLAEARDLMRQVAWKEPDIVIHLGDIYYSGTREEVETYYYRVLKNIFDLQKVLVLSVCGNHELYSGGVAYYELLDRLGQTASYFCLRNANWQFLGMDTSFLASDGVPSSIHRTPALLTDSETGWLNARIQDSGGRRNVLLSHHQPISAFDEIGSSTNEGLLRQVAPSLERVDAWFWGHEHETLIFEPFRGVQNGRCIGCGGMADYIHPGAEPSSAVPLKERATARAEFRSSGAFLQPYAIMDLHGADATVDYYNFDKGVETTSYNEVLGRTRGFVVGYDEPQSAKAEATPRPPSTSASERNINFWISERESNLEEPLVIGEAYTGNVRVGSPMAASFIRGSGATIPDSDVPVSGLLTHWALAPSGLEVDAIDSTVTINANKHFPGEYTAVFDLTIPPRGETPTIRFRLRPLATDARLKMLIYTRERLYRELVVEFAVRDKAQKDLTLAASGITKDVPLATLAEANIGTTHEWTTPPGVLTLAVIAPGTAMVFGRAGAKVFPPGEKVSMSTDKSALTNAVEALQKAAETFRAKSTDYLNDIDPTELSDRLRRFQPQYDWSNLGDYADAAHRQAWDQLATKPELHMLAFYGRKLYDSLFPSGKPIRDWLDTLPAGQRVEIVWRQDSGAGWIPHVSWELLYTGRADPGVPVNATDFWGLKFRIGYTAFDPYSPSMSLGSPNQSWCSSLLFFGDSPKEPASTEARWQREMFKSLGQQWVVPAGAASSSPKAELVRELTNPSQTPLAVLYLFCHYGLNSSNIPVLRFGLDSSDPNDVLNETELGTAEFASSPLVFANACSTATAGVYSANELAKSFFDRRCRAYVGTESKVPVQMASRFAAVFFRFLFRLVDPQPMAAGEAMAQTRLFLWCHYKNIGGLLYSYVNQYDLYLASETEIQQLQR
jgi:3',5'-cyclic AMP phosphodiesterase CpdA